MDPKTVAPIRRRIQLTAGEEGRFIVGCSPRHGCLLRKSRPLYWRERPGKISDHLFQGLSMMPLRAVLVLCVSMAAVSALAGDMQKYLSDTQDMVRDGKYPQALDRFLWFHENALKRDPAMSGVRLSFALSDWKQLGDAYPPAKTALVETRNRESRQFYADKNLQAFIDAAAINRELDEEPKTIEMFQWADVAAPDLAKQCWRWAKPAILNAKRYDLAGRYIGNPVREFDVVKEMYDMMANRGAGAIGGATLKQMQEDRFVEQCLQLIDLSLALDEPKAAKEIQEKALAVVDDRRLRKAIPTPEQAAK